MRWGDMDALGHVNNTVYFRYLEQTRIAWAESVGIGTSLGEGPILGKATCRFIRPLVYPGEVVVTLACTAVSNRSFTLVSAMRKVGDEALIYAEGEVTMVWIDFAAGSSRPIPVAVRKLLSGAPA